MNIRHYLLSLLLLFCLAIPCPASQNLKAQNTSISIAAINFEGNKSISAQQLKTVFRMTGQGGLYSAENLQSDLLLLEKAYQDEGFLRVKIGAPDVQAQKLDARKGVTIRIYIEEGPRYVSGKVSVKNATVLGPETLIQMYPIPKGQPYRRNQIAQWKGKIEEAYSSIGHIKARCNMHEFLNEIEKTVDCVLDCTEGKPYSVGKITIAGDESIDRSKFKRRLLLAEGGAFNRENLIQSIYFINQSGMYKPISISDIEMMIDDARGVVDLTFHLFLRK